MTEHRVVTICGGKPVVFHPCFIDCSGMGFCCGSPRLKASLSWHPGTQHCSQSIVHFASDALGWLVCGFPVSYFISLRRLITLFQSSSILQRRAMHEESIKQSPVLEPKGIWKCGNLNLLRYLSLLKHLQSAVLLMYALLDLFGLSDVEHASFEAFSKVVKLID